MKLFILLLLSFAVSAQEKPDSPKPKPVALRPPNHADSGSPCADYEPLPAGWICDDTREILLCADGWEPYGLDKCVPGEKPRETAIKHPYANRHFWIASAAMAGSSAGPIIGGKICRDNNGVEPCTMHYGAYNTWTGMNTAANTFVWPAIFYMCRKETLNGRWCWLIPGGVVGYNVAWGIHEAGIHHPDTSERLFRRKR
jgi:hypothetical protein